jgi:hypothetical protein
VCSIAKRPCRHCRVRPGSRPRGLCWVCYLEPDTRASYFSLSKFGGYDSRPGDKEAVGNFRGPGKPTASATSALPGTPEKVAVLAQRAQDREILWHPGDAHP